MTANEAQIEGTGEKVNLFDYHVKADTILFFVDALSVVRIRIAGKRIVRLLRKNVRLRIQTKNSGINDNFLYSNNIRFSLFRQRIA